MFTGLAIFDCICDETKMTIYTITKLLSEVQECVCMGPVCNSTVHLQSVLH